jgi:two-component system, LytTR family, response regulator
MLTAIAIDDEPDAIELIRILAEKVPFLELKETFTNAFKAIAWLRENPVDLLFLDIKMPDINGIELMNSLPQPPMVIFTTAYSQYAVEGFDLNAVDYLLQPFSAARFVKACTRAIELKSRSGKPVNAFIFVKTGYEEEKVMLDEIRYLQSDGNYMTYFLSDRQLLSRQSMSEALRTLPPAQFARVHRSFIVSIAAIQKISKMEIGLGDVTIPVGPSFEEQVAGLRAALRG